MNKKTRIKNAILIGLIFGFLNGIVQYIIKETENPIFSGLLSGILFGILMYFLNKPNKNIELAEGENDIYSGPANYFKKFFAIGGKLYLLNDKLEFKVHKLNILNKGQVINLNEIREVGYFNHLGLIPNGLIIKTKQGKNEKFVVQEREVWKEKIEQKLSKIKERVA